MAKGISDDLALKVVDGLIAAHFRLPDPAALANTLIDYLHLACCGAYRLHLQSGAGKRSRPGVRVGDHRLALEALSPAGAVGGEDPKHAAGRISSIIELLQERQPELWRYVEAQFVEAVSGEPAVPPAATAPACAEDVQLRLLERVTERIKQSLDEYEQARFPRELFLSAESPGMRVVTVHRYFKGDAPFGRVVLAPSQAHGPGDDAAIDSLPAPLSQFPLAVRRCFDYGFALYGNCGGPESVFGTAVKRAVGLPTEGEGPMACFIPCHVGGVAWTAAVIVAPSMDREFAELCLRLYREWIPRVFEALRTRTHADFQDWMLESYQRALAGPSVDRDEINRDWACIRQNYPLPRWDLEPAHAPQHDREMLRLTKIRGQEWAVAKIGSVNEYYRPSARLSQPASWGSGTLWGETLLERLREITSVTSQSHDLQRLRAVQQSVASWAHEVKGYTNPIISDLRSALRKTEEVSPAFEPLRRALRAVIILNASSFAAQKILENRATPSAETQIFLLPRRNSADIVEAMLQYLLQYWRSASLRPLKLSWDNELPEGEALRVLASALGISESNEAVDEVLLTHPAVVGVVALLREVVFNIKCTKPVAEPLVHIGRRTSLEPNQFKLTLEQRQQERFAWSSHPDIPRGIERANRLYGPDGAQLGHILTHPPEQVRTEGGYLIKYLVEVAFNLAP